MLFFALVLILWHLRGFRFLSVFYWFPPDEEDYETPPGTTWVELVALSILLLGAAAALRSAFPRFFDRLALLLHTAFPRSRLLVKRLQRVKRVVVRAVADGTGFGRLGIGSGGAAAAAGAGMGYASGPRPFRLRGTGGTGNYSALDKKFASSGGGSWEYLGYNRSGRGGGRGISNNGNGGGGGDDGGGGTGAAGERREIGRGTGRVVRIAGEERGLPQQLPDLPVRRVFRLVAPPERHLVRARVHVYANGDR
ncbi:unnamed protein product, partial [Closterium sp. Naga37s-1]